MNRRAFFGRLAGVFAVPLLPSLRFPLLALGNDFPRDPEWLARWLRAPRRLILESDQALTRELILAVRAGSELRIIYYGGSLPGTVRRITPGSLFEVEGFGGIYMAGYCHRRKQERVFRLDLVELC